MGIEQCDQCAQDGEKEYAWEVIRILEDGEGQLYEVVWDRLIRFLLLTHPQWEKGQAWLSRLRAIGKLGSGEE